MQKRSMEIKRNQATKNRPKGDRIIDAPIMIIDLHQSVSQLKEENAWQKSDRNGMTIFKSDDLAVVLVTLKPGAEINNNIIDGILMVKVVSGRIRIIMPGDDSVINKDQLVILHPLLA